VKVLKNLLEENQCLLYKKHSSGNAYKILLSIFIIVSVKTDINFS